MLDGRISAMSTGSSRRISEALHRRWLTNHGPYVQELENKICDLVGVKHCIAICNATTALEITSKAAGLTGEVIVPSFTFIATPHALQWQQITPVFCDVDPRTHNLDPRRVEALITPRTSGIFGVHLWGRGCEVEALAEIARRRNLRLLFDAAHAFGCSHHGRMVGNFGDAEVFSFHATKFFNTLEGGAVVTNDDELAGRVRLMANYGFAGYDRVIALGINGKMNEISAAMGLTGLESLAEVVATNRRHYLRYREALRDLRGVRMLSYPEQETCNYQYIVLEVDEAVTGLSRDTLMRVLWAENVLARRYFYPGCHRMEPYVSSIPRAGLSLPETEALAQRVLVLPTGTAVGSEAIDTICQIIRFAVEHSAALTARVGTLPGAALE